MWRLRQEIYSTEIFRNSLKLLRILPVPSTTLHNGSAAMHIQMVVARLNGLGHRGLLRSEFKFHGARNFKMRSISMLWIRKSLLNGLRSWH